MRNVALNDKTQSAMNSYSGIREITNPIYGLNETISVDDFVSYLRLKKLSIC